MNEKTLPHLLVQVKAFHTLDENIKSLRLFLDNLQANAATLFVSAPYTQIETISKTFNANGITVGVNEMVNANSSTFTGSIAGRMVGVSEAHFVLIPAFGANASEEAAAAVSNEKIKAAFEQNVSPYVTLNESWEEHHDGISKEAMSNRLKKTLAGFSDDQIKKIIFVYNAQWILGGLWENSSSDLQSAYKNITEAINGAFSEKIPSSRLIISVPSYSTELLSLINALQNQNENFLGFFCGDLGPGTTQMQPLFSSKPTQKTVATEKASPSKIQTKEEITPQVKSEEPAKKKRTRAKPAENNSEET